MSERHRPGKKWCSKCERFVPLWHRHSAMTPEERTDAILSVLTANGRHVVAAIYDGEEARQRVVAHVREVIAEEREACAKLADRCTPDNPNHADDGCCASDIAAAIRGRA